MNASTALRLALAAVLLAHAALPVRAAAQEGRPPVPAFPGAEGFGAFTKGGRGGAVYHVTNLEDYASGETRVEGSLRAAVEAEGPRTIVFRVAGNIALKRTLEIKEPYLTIAGQTAPGDGVVITHYGLSIEAPEVIIRHLRVRPGDVAGEQGDAINVLANNVIIDHCSVSWATDETLSVTGDATDVTIQWCLITESLNDSVHEKGEHGYGSLLSTSGRVSIHHTAYAFHKSRNPRPKDVLLDFRNNLVYGFGDRAGYNADDFTRMNYVGNYIRPLAYSSNAAYAFIVGGANTRLYLEDNLLRADEADVRDSWQMIRPPRGMSQAEAARRLGVAVPFAAPSVATDSPEAAFERILADAGATRPRRDPADRRVVGLIRAGEGRIIDSQEEVGGWPALQSGAPAPDADADGMPDAWERRYGFDPEDPADGAADRDDDGYTNLEEYLNDTDPSEPFAWVAPPLIRPASGTAFAGEELVVTIEPADPAVPVYYTLDGREPTTAARRYDGPFRITGSAHVRARAIAEGRPTTTAVATFECLSWMPPADRLPGDLRPGLRYALYETDDWDEGPAPDALTPLRTGVTPEVDFGLRPAGGPNAVVFDGYLRAPEDGIYAFHLRDDARSRLYIDETLVTPGRPEAGPPGQVALRAGLHRFRLESLHEEPRETVLRWSGPGIPEQPVPSALLCHPAGR